jgi:hypothetical protein
MTEATEITDGFNPPHVRRKHKLHVGRGQTVEGSDKPSQNRPCRGAATERTEINVGPVLPENTEQGANGPCDSRAGEERVRQALNCRVHAADVLDPVEEAAVDLRGAVEQERRERSTAGGIHTPVELPLLHAVGRSVERAVEPTGRVWEDGA